jgi:hypothetical protein
LPELAPRRVVNQLRPGDHGTIDGWVVTMT